MQQAYNALKVNVEADIVAQKQTAEALQASEERFQLLFNKAPLDTNPSILMENS